jgi:hypothetical protein
VARTVSGQIWKTLYGGKPQIQTDQAVRQPRATWGAFLRKMVYVPCGCSYRRNGASSGMVMSASASLLAMMRVIAVPFDYPRRAYCAQFNL